MEYPGSIRGMEGDFYLWIDEFRLIYGHIYYSFIGIECLDEKLLVKGLKWDRS